MRSRTMLHDVARSSQSQSHHSHSCEHRLSAPRFLSLRAGVILISLRAGLHGGPPKRLMDTWDAWMDGLAEDGAVTKVFVSESASLRLTAPAVGGRGG